MTTGTTSTCHTPEGDIEDAIAKEHPQGPVTAHVTINGQATTKPKALCLRMMYHSNHASTDRLKCVQNMPCFGATSSSDSNIISFDSTLGGPCLRIGNPIAVLVCCKNQIFLAIAQVNWLSFASECDLHELALHLLVDSSAKVDFQVLHLVPATVIDDPEEQYDWCWSLGMDTTCEGVAGWLLHPVNPAISVRTPGNLTFLFESSFLLTMAVSLHQELLPQDLRNLPSVKHSEYFPYQYFGLSCLLSNDSMR